MLKFDENERFLYANDMDYFREINGKTFIHPRERSIHIAHFRETPAYIPNPGMGVLGYVYSDHMHTGYLPGEFSKTEHNYPMPWDEKTFQRMVDSGKADGLYIRMEWKDIQKEPGKLSLPTPWLKMLDVVRKKGLQWSFRIMSCCPHSTAPYSVPEFLIDKMDFVPYTHGVTFGGTPDPKHFPDYTPEYFKWWGEMLELLGKEFDDDPALAFGDISGFGLWGEGHHGIKLPGFDNYMNYQHRSPEEMEAAVKTLIDLHTNAFPKTPGVISLHMAEYRAGRNGVLNGKIWPRRDSFRDTFSTKETELVLSAQEGRGMIWETVMPVVGSDYDDIIQRYGDFGYHFASIGFNTWDFDYALDHEPALSDKLHERIGYKLRPSVIWRRSIDRGPQELVLGMCNDASIAPPGEITIHALFPNGEKTSTKLPLGSPAPGKMQMFALQVPFSCADLGPESEVSLSLSLEIKGKTHPVRWGLEQNGVAGPFAIKLPMREIPEYI